MAKIQSWLPLVCLLIGGWAVLNGILHDIFVLKEGRKYDRDLLRLLMDGHILLTCGIVQMLCYKGLKIKDTTAIFVAGTASISLVVYCFMIMPFLKAVGMLVLNLILSILLIVSLIG